MRAFPCAGDRKRSRRREDLSQAQCEGGEKEGFPITISAISPTIRILRKHIPRRLSKFKVARGEGRWLTTEKKGQQTHTLRTREEEESDLCAFESTKTEKPDST
jgi:hypothetical protein